VNTSEWDCTRTGIVYGSSEYSRPGTNAIGYLSLTDWFTAAHCFSVVFIAVRWCSLSCAVVLAAASCTTRKSAAPPPPSYPAVPANSVQILERQPSQPYDVIGTITVQTDTETTREQAITDIRQRAGNSGANVIVVLSDKAFTWRNAAIRQHLHTRRIVARAIRLP
jgi:uncharacterized protein YbjQ (UPF0145 family)